MHIFCIFFAKLALKFDFIGVLVAFCAEIEPNSILVNGRNFLGYNRCQTMYALLDGIQHNERCFDRLLVGANEQRTLITNQQNEQSDQTDSLENMKNL